MGQQGAPWAKTCPTSHEGGWPRDRTVPTKVPLDSTPPTTTYITRLRRTAAPAGNAQRPGGHARGWRGGGI
eukprot:scaffold66904_cov37-Phaeocystis_antarctica.AAC.5